VEARRRKRAQLKNFYGLSKGDGAPAAGGANGGGDLQLSDPLDLGPLRVGVPRASVCARSSPRVYVQTATTLTLTSTWSAYGTSAACASS
jgi:hypothetical protein